jgi:hypothetical protein
MVVVCSDTKDSVTNCEYCKTKRAKRKFCSNACRQAAYRNSDAYKRNLLKQGVRRLKRRNDWYAEKTRDKHLTFDGIFSGHEIESAGRLGDRTMPELQNWEEHIPALLQHRENMGRGAG